MAYATVAHVQAKNAARPAYSATTKPTASQVIQFLNETAAEIDTILYRAGYGVPVPTTAASSVQALLQHANAVGAAYYAEWSAPTSDRRNELEDMWETAKKMLATTELEMAKDSSQSLPRTSVASSLFFSRDMVL